MRAKRLQYDHKAITPEAPLSPLPSLESLEKGDMNLTSKRTDITTYGSMKMKAALGPVVKSLSHGSYRKAVRLLLTSSNDQVKKQAIKGIKDAVNLEINSLIKVNKTVLAKGSEEDLTSFQLSDFSEPLKRTIIWEVMSSAATKEKRKPVEEVKVSTAALILLNARSKFLSRFQYVVSVAMYNNQLQREGYNILSRMGLTVSHSALHRCLKKAQLTVDRKMEELKTGIERNEVIRTVSGVADEHSYASLTRDEEVTPDHTYDQQVQQISHKTLNPCYRMNIDNLDFLLKVRDMTETHQNKSKHYVQAMAVVDRVPCEHLPDDRPIADLMTISIQDFLPSEDDNNSLRDDFIQMVSLILTEHVPAFKVCRLMK